MRANEEAGRDARPPFFLGRRPVAARASDFRTSNPLAEKSARIAALDFGPHYRGDVEACQQFERRDVLARPQIVRLEQQSIGVTYRDLAGE
jgi:hypothetical protein